MTTDDAAGMFRHNDPETSKLGAFSALPRINSQHAELLLIPWPKGGLTPDEAAQLAGLYDTHACYWKRVGELARKGLLECSGHRRSRLSGRVRLVYRLTPEGRRSRTLLRWQRKAQHRRKDHP